MAYRHQHQYRSPFGDTTYTKVFVGGLAWETPTDRMREYFEQFGDILEAVIITDKNTGKSKGYGFVTFRDPDSANRACEIANPMIDGRRANCNIASFGRPRPSPPRGQGGPSSPPPPQQRFGGVPTTAMHPMPPHPAANAFYYQSNYGYTPYAPGYGYHQAMYNPQYQQAQYYPQAALIGGSGGSSSMNMNMNMNMSSPYGYGYPYSGSRATYYHHPAQAQAHAHAQRLHMYYPPQPQPQIEMEMEMEGPSPTPYSSAAASTTPIINPSNNITSLQNPAPITALQAQPSFSPSSESQHKERTSTETDAVVVTSGGSSGTF